VFPVAPTWAEATAGLSWKVSKVQLVTKDTHAAAPNVYGIVREDTGEVLGVVGSKYHLVQNEQLFSVVKHLVDGGQAEIESAGSLFNGAKVFMLLKVRDLEATEVQAGDKVQPYLLVTSSHDGSATVKVGFTAIRVVCNNTLTASLNREGFTSIRHNAKAADALELVAATIDIAKREVAATATVYKELANRKIASIEAARLIKAWRNRKKLEAVAEQDEAAQVAAELLLGATIGATRDVDSLSAIPEESTRELNIQEKMLQVFNLEANATGNASAWALYNAINWYSCHLSGRTDDRRLESQWFDGADDRELLQWVVQQTAA
jgi:phage/plasmid-like protein (TIGR03299 family)